MAEAGSGALSASLEDYLEAILRIVQEKHVARAKEVGERLRVGRSSVTGALHALADRALIHYAPYDLITLTERGRELAEGVARRHEGLRTFLVKVLSVAPAEADEAACKLEHAIPEKILDRLVDFAAFVERCPRGGSKWIEGFGYYCRHHRTDGDCETCLGEALEEAKARRMKPAGEERVLPTLAEVKPGGRATIKTVAGSGGIRRRLLDMGVTPGTAVEVERVAPLGDPLEVKVKGYHLTLRREEAARIRVEPA